jgi:hypothetical protein
LRRPWQQCHGDELPTTLVKNKVAFAGFEAGVSALSILAQYEMIRHARRKLAWLGQAIDVGFVGGTVANNDNCETTPSVTV